MFPELHFAHAFTTLGLFEGSVFSLVVQRGYRLCGLHRLHRSHTQESHAGRVMRGGCTGVAMIGEGDGRGDGP